MVRSKHSQKKNETPQKQRKASSWLLNRHWSNLIAAIPLLLIMLLISPVFYLRKDETLTFPNDMERGFCNGTNCDQLKRTRIFLDDFVCQYKPSGNSVAGDNTSAVDIPGYCHPNLISDPQNRTQVVSSFPRPQRTIQSNVVTVLMDAISWWTNAFAKKLPNHINRGELLMTLPRPLQIWDLDALRDEFIRQQFLGFARESSSEFVPSRHRVTRHRDTSNLLDSGAYLAVHLLRLLHGSRGTSSNNQRQGEIDQCTDESTTLVRWTDTRQYAERILLLKPYLDILPTYHHRPPSPTGVNLHEHPLAWNHTIIEALFPKYTHTYNLISNYQRMVHSEYSALSDSSTDEFGVNVNYTEYLGMRINVLSRAFGVSVSGDDHGSRWNGFETQTLVDEMESYQTSNFGGTGLDPHTATTIIGQSSEKSLIEFKFRSMCPLLDMYNSHPNPNAVWTYDSMTSSFVVHANKEGISSGRSIIVSYGKYTEGHLFAKYGYVNGDGSTMTEVGLNVFHRMAMDVGLSWQFSPLPFYVQNHQFSEHNTETFPTGSSDVYIDRSKTIAKHILDMQSRELLRYLVFDDGYEECVNIDEETLNSHQRLKLLKLQHLKRLANIDDAWVIRLPARSPNARPFDEESNMMNNPDGNEDRVGINAKGILSVCRMLSLTVDDINGDAIKYMNEGLSSSYYLTSSSKLPYLFVEKGKDELEYRALMCVARLSEVGLKRYKHYAELNGNIEPNRSHRRDWIGWYIRNGEMRLLRLLRQTAKSEAIRLRNRLHPSNRYNIMIRERPCPIEYSLPLLKHLESTSL